MDHPSPPSPLPPLPRQVRDVLAQAGSGYIGVKSLTTMNHCRSGAGHSTGLKLTRDPSGSTVRFPPPRGSDLGRVGSRPEGCRGGQHGPLSKCMWNFPTVVFVCDCRVRPISHPPARAAKTLFVCRWNRSCCLRNCRFGCRRRRARSFVWMYGSGGPVCYYLCFCAATQR